MNEQVRLVTEVANKVVKAKYPSFGDNHYTDFDTAVILQSYLTIVEHLKDEIPKKKRVQKQSPV